MFCNFIGDYRLWQIVGLLCSFIVILCISVIVLLIGMFVGIGQWNIVQLNWCEQFLMFLILLNGMVCIMLFRLCRCMVWIVRFLIVLRWLLMLMQLLIDSEFSMMMNRLVIRFVISDCVLKLMVRLIILVLVSNGVMFMFMLVRVMIRVIIVMVVNSMLWISGSMVSVWVFGWFLLFRLRLCWIVVLVRIQISQVISRVVLKLIIFMLICLFLFFVQ